MKFTKTTSCGCTFVAKMMWVGAMSNGDFLYLLYDHQCTDRCDDCKNCCDDCKKNKQEEVSMSLITDDYGRNGWHADISEYQLFL